MKFSKAALVSCVAALSVVSVLGLASCSSSSSEDEAVAATVNGTEIKEQTITDYVQNFREAQSLTDDDSWGQWMAQYSLDPSSVRDEVIEYYEEIELVNQAAEEQGVSVSDDDVQAQVDKMKANYSSDDAWQQALSQAGTTEDQYRESVKNAMTEEALKDKVASDGSDPSDDDVLTYVKQYATYFDGAKKSSHILFNSDDRDTAQQVLDQINNGEISFEDAAKQYSTDTASAEDGGNVGWDKLNSFVTEYTDALDQLDEGQVSGLVDSDYGIHIIKCTEVYHAPDEVTSLDQAPSELVDYIRSMVKSQNESSAYQTWFEDYKNNADIQKNDMPSGLPYDIDMSQYQSDNNSSDDNSSDDSSNTDASTDDNSSNDAATDDNASNDSTDSSDNAADSSNTDSQTSSDDASNQSESSDNASDSNSVSSQPAEQSNTSN